MPAARPADSGRPATTGTQRGLCPQAVSGLDDKHRPERDQDPVPDVEALIDSLADVDGDDEGEGGNCCPVSAAMMRLGHVPSLIAPVHRLISQRAIQNAT